MSISRVIKAIREYQEVKETTESSDKYSFPLQQARNQIETEVVALIDSRIKTRCIFCPPDDHPENAFCRWEFSLE